MTCYVFSNRKVDFEVNAALVYCGGKSPQLKYWKIIIRQKEVLLAIQKNRPM